MSIIDEIAEEMEWETSQREIANNVTEAEKNGWGFTAFKAYIRSKLAHLSEEEMVYGYQAYLLQTNFPTPREWAPFYYEQWCL